MKKLLTIMTALVLALAVAMPVMADTATPEVKGAKVEDATAPDSYKENKPTPGDAVKTGTTTDEIFTLTYDSASLKLVYNGEEETNRPDGNAWIGVKVTAPEGAKKFTVKQDTKLGNTQAIDASKLTSTFETDGKTFHEYFHVNESELKDAVKNKKAYIIYALKYTWDYSEQAAAAASNDENKVKTTTVVVKIKVEGVTLVDEKAGETDKTLWNKQKYDEEVAKVKAQTSNKTTNNTTNKKKDKTPGTGVENVYAVAGLVAVVTLAGAVVLNKRK